MLHRFVLLDPPDATLLLSSVAVAASSCTTSSTSPLSVKESLNWVILLIDSIPPEWKAGPRLITGRIHTWVCALIDPSSLDPHTLNLPDLPKPSHSPSQI